MYIINNKILQDSEGNIVKTVSDEIILTNDLAYKQRDYSLYVDSVKSNWTTHVIKLYLLNGNDETPIQDVSSYVLSGNLSYNYQQGQTHSLSIDVVNNDGFWSTDPINGNIHNRSKFRLDIGLFANGVVYWKKCGIFVLKSVNAKGAPSQIISLQLYDKFALFDKKIGGNIDTDFKINAGTNLKEAIDNCVHYKDDYGNIYDTKDVIYEYDVSSIVTPYTISKTPNTSMGDIIVELANMASCDVFYNENGNLTIRAGSEVSSGDGACSYDQKPVQWYYIGTEQLSYADPSYEIDYGAIVNKLTVCGAITNGTMAKGVAVNTNPYSNSNTIINPINSEVIEDSNITSDNLAQERAVYELEKRQLAYTKNSFNSIFIPHLNPKDIVMWTNPELNIYNEKFIIQSLSYQLGSGFFMSVSMTNVKEVGTSG